MYETARKGARRGNATKGQRGLILRRPDAHDDNRQDFTKRKLAGGFGGANSSNEIYVHIDSRDRLLPLSKIFHIVGARIQNYINCEIIYEGIGAAAYKELIKKTPLSLS